MVGTLPGLVIAAWLEHKKLIIGAKVASVGGAIMARRKSKWKTSMMSPAKLAKLGKIGGRRRLKESRVPGGKGALQRVIPGGATGYRGDITRTPGIKGAVERLIPGGATGFELTDLTIGTHGGVVKSWVANGAVFNMNQDGTISVLKKNGTVKTYRPYKPVVFGKEPNTKALIKVNKKHKAIYKDLHAIFGKKGVRK